MAKKKLNARQRDIQRLTTQYQSQLSALAPEYESVFQKKEAAIQAGSGQAGEYAKKLEEFNKQLAVYKANPFEDQKVRGSFRYQNIKKAGKEDPYEWGYVIDGGWRSAKNLPENYVEEKVGGEFALKKKAIPTFTEAAPAPADLSQFDKETEAVEAKKKTLGEGFQREVAERKASRVGAVSRRAQSRPMMAKGVTL
jgi:hypothetical protein